MAGAESARSGDLPAKVSIRDEQRLMTRRRILDAAVTVFGAKGYSGTSIGDITTEAGINRATFYIHFTSKADVLKGAAEPAMAVAEVNWSELDAVLASGSGPEVRRWLETALAWWDDNADVLPAVREAMVVDSAVWEHFEVAVNEFSLRIQTYLGGFEPQDRDDARGRVQLLVAQLDHVFNLHLFRTGVGLDRERLLELLTDMWVKTLDLPRS